MSLVIWPSLALVLLILLVLVRRSRLGERSGVRVARISRGRDETRTLWINGIARTFHVHVPDKLAASRPASVVLVFHGGGRGRGRSIARRTGFSALSERHECLAVYPDGYGFGWNDGRGTTEAERAGTDDVAFVRAVIDDLENRFFIDRERIYAVGLSNGGMFVNRLGCELSDRLAAIAVVCGPMPEPLATRCRPERPISVLGIFGTADPFIPWEGGEVRGGDRGQVLGAEAMIDLWVKSNRCDSRPVTEVLPTVIEDGTVVERTTYGGGDEGRTVVLYRIEGGGHSWPCGRTAPRRGARSSLNLDATRVIWEFFLAQPPRSAGSLAAAGSAPGAADSRGMPGWSRWLRGRRE